MGGPGSTRWDGYLRRDAVEDCKPLDIDRLRRNGQLFAPGPGTYLKGVLRFYAEGDDESPTSSLGYRVDSDEDAQLTCTFMYHTQGRDIDLPVPIERVPTPFQGERWHWRCPRCQRRCRKLYLPLGGVLFLCRVCHDLRYRSQQEHYWLDDWLRARGLRPKDAWK